MANVAVIIPAAGSGSRFGGRENKIFMPLKGRAVFLRTLDLFVGRSDVLQVLLCVSPADRQCLQDRFGGELAAMSVTVVDGRPVRSDSVRNALAALDSSAELVCVHDAVRPCVPAACIDAVFAAAARHGGALLAIPVHGTVKKVSQEGVIEQTVDRDGLWEAQTPQVFDAAILRDAYAPSTAATDDAHLVQSAGHRVRVVPGDARNLKITTPDDLVFAETVFDSIR